MAHRINRRKFLIKTTAATAAAYAWKPLGALGLRSNERSLSSSLLPANSGTWVDVARNRAVYQSSSIDDDHTAHLITDGSEATYWECKPTGEQWAAVDLGEVTSFSRVGLRWGKIHANIYRIEVSSEGPKPAHWTTIYKTTESKGGVEELDLGLTNARHIRLVGMPDDRGFSLSELEVWDGRKHVSPVTPQQVVTKNGNLLHSGWTLQSAMFALNTPADISSAQYVGKDWMPAVVPGTVLVSYLEHGAVPDPYYGNQQSQISEEFFTRNDFWYRKSFVISPQCRGRRLWLVLEGINWKADVYLNGTKLGDISGAFIRGRFDITELALLGRSNCLAVLVHQVANPGEIEHKQLGKSYKNGGVIGLDSPTFLSSIGWNWVPAIRGRNIGIWNDVRFETSGDVVLADPWVASELPTPDNMTAELTVRTDITNHSDIPKRCALLLSMEKIACRQELTLQPHETRTLTIDKAECTALVIRNPRLWWPNGYGDQVLHTMQLRIEVDGAVSDQKSVTFGIRQMDYKDEDGILSVFVNGHKILCRGGNWGMDEAMLMCDAEGYDLRIKMHRDMNLNMIRNWIGMVGKDVFYSACDRHGILVWDDFWLANPGDGPDPADHAMFMNNAIDKVRRVRHHASLAIYCGRNEGMPPPDLDAGMRDAISRLDGTRYYIPASASGLVTGHGPYDNQEPQWYFQHRGGTFHTEQGIVCIPPVESMRAMMPEEDLWPIGDMWAIHEYQNPRSVLYTERLGQRYGAPTDIEDYCRKAQMANLESAKAMYECLQSRQGSGQLVWMTQSAWPALICQLYDYYFEQSGAYFGTKSACEPLHILWDQYTNQIKVANNTIAEKKQLQAVAWIYALDGKEQWHKTIELTIPATSVRECFPLEVPTNLGDIYFVKLKLNGAETTFSENFYWSPMQDSDCRSLDKLPRVKLSVSARMTTSGDTHTLSATVSNPTAIIALAIRLKMVRNPSHQRVLPAMYEDNYFSLLPHESRTVAIRFQSSALGGNTPKLILEGWNIVLSESAVHFS
jgi:Exo-beta-D-glucosaminidase Ig-fold domain/F5/8 type C domain/Glycosyl hydrolases family 2